MANPGVPQGTLNRLKASIIFSSFQSLNVSPSYLAPEAIDFTLEGQATAVLPTMTGVVTSPEPYQMARLTLHLLKSQAFANLWKQQQELSTLLGDCTVRPDASTIDPFQVGNCSIIGVDRMNFGGREAGFIVNIAGSYNLNSSLWS
jgi:hypothetical protein